MTVYQPFGVIFYEHSDESERFSEMISGHGLPKFPREMWKQITRGGALLDLEIFRLCCRPLETVSRPQMFARVVLSPHGGSFGRIEALSKHRYALHLREVLYHLTVVLHDDHFSAVRAGNQEPLCLRNSIQSAAREC